MAIYRIHNGAAAGAAAPVMVTTGTVIKTMLQLAAPSTHRLTIKEWGISFNGYTAATPIKVELLTTSGAATVTAAVAADITKFDPDSRASFVTLGASATGYTGGSEGTPGTCRMFDLQFIAPTNQYAWQWPLGDEPVVAVSEFLRIRVTAGTAVDAYCWIKWAE